MAKLPDVTSMERALPQSRRDIVSYNPDQTGANIAAIGGQVVEQVDKAELAQGRLQVNYAEANLLRKKTELLNNFDTDQDYATFQARYEKAMKEAKDEQLKTISRGDVASAFDAYAEKFIAGGVNEVTDKARRKQQDYTLASSMQILDNNREIYLTAPNEETKARALRNTENIIGSLRDSGNLSQQAAYQTLKEWKEKTEIARLEMLPLDDRLKELQPLSIRNNNPGNLRGANGEFRKFSSKEEGMAAMQADLTAKVTGNSPAMKRNFGDNYLPTIENIINTYAPRTENDTDAYIKTVSQETGIAPDVPLKAKDVDKLMSAMIKVEGGNTASNYYASALPSDIRVKMEIQTRELIRKEALEDAKLKIEDAPEWGRRRGLSVGQIVGAQINRRTASVLPKSYASQMVEQIKQAKSIDTFFQLTDQVRQAAADETGDYIDNAIQDLRRNGLPVELESAIKIAALNEGRGKEIYNQHLVLLHGASIAGKEQVNENAKLRGFKLDEIESAINSRFAADEMTDILIREYGSSEAQERSASSRAVTSTLVKAYLFQNPSSSLENAINFALQPDDKGIAELNGVKYRVPKALLTADIEERLNRKYEDYARELQKTQSDNFSLIEGAVIPVLNDAEDGLFFVDPIGDPIRDASGKSLSITFEELLKTKTDKEKRAEYEKAVQGMSYSEREAFRKKFFNIQDSQ